MNKKTAKSCIIASVAVFVIYMGLSAFVDVVKAASAVYRAESVCVAKLIAVEVERKDITTGNGTCKRKVST